MSKLRRNNLPRQPHTPLTEQLGSTEHKIRKEIAIMKKLNHPHVVRLLEVIDDPLTDKIYMGEYAAYQSLSCPSRRAIPAITLPMVRSARHCLLYPSLHHLVVSNAQALSIRSGA